MHKPLALNMELISVALKTAPVCDGCGRGNGGKGNKFQPISGREGPRRYRAWKLNVDSVSKYFCTACANQMAATAAAARAGVRSPLSNYQTNCPDCTEYFSAASQAELDAALADHRAKTGCGEKPAKDYFAGMNLRDLTAREERMKLKWTKDGDTWRAGPFVIGPNIGQYYLEIQPHGACLVAGVPIRVAQQAAQRIADAILEAAQEPKPSPSTTPDERMAIGGKS